MAMIGVGSLNAAGGYSYVVFALICGSKFLPGAIQTADA
jgi:hypothetical protein